MKAARQLVRSAQRLGMILENGSSGSLHPRARCLSTVACGKILEGSNGERIIASPYEDCSIPNISIPDLIWENINNYDDKVALECGVTGRRYTYAEARDASNYVGRSLLNMGLRPGDVVALITPNLPETAIAVLGILEAGLIVTTVNPIYTVDEISRQLKNSAAKAVISAAEVAATSLAAAKASLPPDSPFIVIDDATKPAPEGAIPFKDLITRGKSLPPLPSQSRSSENIAVLPYSSGTTGLPKGVMLTHKNVVADLTMLMNSVGDELKRPTIGDYQETIPAFLPFFHIFGMNGVMLNRLWLGGKLITVPRFAPEIVLNVLENHKASMLYCVPPIVLFLTASPQIKKHHIENVHAAFSGAAPLSKEDVDRFYEKFGINHNMVKFCQGYGLTETSLVSFLEESGTKYASIGKPISTCEARVVDVTTNEDVTGPGQTGELWVRGPHIMKGYLNNETATKEILLDDGWLKTGDIVYYDDDLDFFVSDRLKELIKVKGFQVAPAELEAILRTHPDVQEAAVIGIPDARSGEVPRAFIVAKSDKKLSEEEIKNFVKGKVSEFKELQGGVQFVQNIPKNSTGKILRMQLRNECLKSN